MQSILKRVRPPRPDWYEEFYAFVLDTGMKSYEEEVGGHVVELMRFRVCNFIMQL